MYNRARVIAAVLAVVTLVWGAPHGFIPPADAAKPRHRKARHRTVPARPKPADPALAWKDCGDACLKDLFHGDLSSTRLPAVRGELRDVAVRGGRLYLLVKNFNLVSDAIFIIRRDTGKIETIWGIGRHEAESMTCDGGTIWILSRSNRYFLRKLSLEGRPTGDLRGAILPGGAWGGLAAGGGVIAFAARDADGSHVFCYGPADGSLRKIYSTGGAIGAMAFRDGVLLAYLKEFDTYAEDWLLALDPRAGLRNKTRFVDRAPYCFAADGKRLFMVERMDSGAVVSPLAIMPGGAAVLADPHVAGVKMTYHVTGRGGRRFSGDLWVPYPLNRRFQNVRRVSLEPPPREIVADRSGNRWALVRWENASGAVKAVLSFDAITAAAACSVDREYRLKSDDVPSELRVASAGETGVFDLSHYVVRSHSTRLDPGGTWLARVLGIRDYVNASVRFSAYDERWGRASDYLFRGRGDAYGRTVAFAALARYTGMHARAAGGILLEGVRREIDPCAGETWNQVYLPGAGWIDVGFGRGYGDRHERFSSRPARCFVTFEGDFDRCDFSAAFAEKGWLGVFRPSAGAGGEPDAALGKIQVVTRTLAE